MTAERRVRFELAYDGTAYHGWQFQPRERTVQGTVEAALARMTAGRRAPVRGAGRTDAGVHARGQVADARVPASLSDESIRRALASILPDDIVVHDVRGADPAFHAWRDAVSKTYVYRIDRRTRGDPFLARFALHRPGPLDVAAMDDALDRLPGRRDWSGFADSRCEKADRVRTLLEARYEEREGVGRFVFRADGFLTRMARNLVGTLLEIGRGRMGPERIDSILATGDRRLGGPTAPPKGLCLERVDYGTVASTEEDPWNASW